MKIDLSRPVLVLAAIGVGIDAAVGYLVLRGAASSELGLFVTGIVTAIVAVLVPKPT